MYRSAFVPLVKVDSKVSAALSILYDFFAEAYRGHCLSCSFVIEGAPQGLGLSWIDLGPVS